MAEALLYLSGAQIVQGDNAVLSEVDLRLMPGEFVYLIGSTGSGKSSLLKTLYADLPLTQGLGEVAGFALLGLKEADIPFLRRKLGIVFQDLQLLIDRSVGDNLEFVLRATAWTDATAIWARISEVLAKVGMGGREGKMPHELSGGEQQRVAIARALLNDPPLMLADEPTGNLDPVTSEEIMLLLRKIASEGKAVLMATHDYPLILKFPARTLKCESGRVFETVQRTL
ncbi:ATP-binding cassette domain-containing protein [bacterium]|nr:ATP-binding cassette domain-containing protein [bacterium]